MSRLANALDLCAARGFSLAVAESCTGGLLASRISAIPGASRVFRGGWVIYQVALKERFLSEEAGFIRQVGTVSSDLTARLARQALREAAADLALAVTCSAGPGAEAGSVVGEGYIALARSTETNSDGPEVYQRRVQAAGDREAVRERMVSEAVDLLDRIVCRGQLLDSTL